jgi:DNA-binding transcriptional regulator LsrR (DeoR family)
MKGLGMSTDELLNKNEISNELMEKIRLAAELYYTYGMHQKEIATRLNVSRPWISRLLKRAEELGVVRIEMDTYSAGMAEIEQRLTGKYGIRDAKVVKTSGPQQTIKHCGYVGAHYLVSILKPNDVIGLSWGSTIASMFNQYLPVRFPGVTVMPLVGGIGTNADILSNQLAANLAASLHAKYRLLHTPAFVAGMRERELIINDPTTKEHIDMTENIDIAILTIGSLEQVLKHGENYLSTSEYMELKEKGAVGDIALHLLDREGNLIPHAAHEKLIAGDFTKTIKGARCSIGYGIGEHKVPIIHAALKGGWFDTLITDLETALNVLDL